MPAKNIESRVLKLAAEQFCKDIAEVTTDKSFADLGGDSLDQIEFVMGLEDEFGIQIEDHAGDRITSVQAAIDHITNTAHAV